ncbi:MAG: hypothetical protein HOO06_03930 [Bdellovibrionaceae bacterium]|jgi:hypothetical protein|nr:hypothetical protein [Pseudobdellovibrionaceae bacterium]
MRIIILFLFLNIFPAQLFAQVSIDENEMKHNYLKRVVVFPLMISSGQASLAEDAWWAIRSELTKHQRFVVASKNFMMSKDVFQRRGELDLPDTLILGKLLDAQALVVTILNDQVLKMFVYDSVYGGRLWSGELILNVSIPVKDQLVSEGKKLVGDFIASIPYQGFVDKLNDQNTVSIDDSEPYFYGYFPVVKFIEVGERVKVLKIRRDNFNQLFGSLNSSVIIAEGNIVNKNGNHLKIKLDKVVDVEQIVQGELLSISKEQKRIRDLFELEKNKALEDAVYDPKIKNVYNKKDEVTPLVSALSFLGTLAIFLLIAF